MRVAVLGASGRTGGLVAQAVASDPGLELVARLSRSNPPVAGCFDGVDAIIDFSLPAALAAALPLVGHTPLVTGTTGLEPAIQAALEAQSTRAPVLQAANFSVGVNLLLDLVARAAAALPDAGVEIVEAHHRHKRDAPSGTAIALGRAVADARGVDLDAVARHGRAGTGDPREASEIGFHAIRAGGIVGEHTLWFASDTEVLRLEHVAQNRSAFADGAIRAAKWVSGRPPGLYGMRQVLFDA